MKESGHLFAVLDPTGQNAERESLGLCNCLVTGGAVGENAGKIGYLTDPTAVLLAFDLNGEVAHSEILTAAPAHRSPISPRLDLSLSSHPGEGIGCVQEIQRPW